jgi:aspartate carbamoyltransferase catalytic subunit
LARKFKGYSNDWQGLPIPFIRTPIIATSFLENSTRTKHSFAIAIEKMGATYIDFNAEKSSLKKGESLEQTLLTLYAQGVDLCIIRTSVSGQLAEFKKNPPLKIINGGDGTNQHPTQALLDFLTMLEIGLNPEETTLAIIGDLYHSRVGSSLIDLLPQFGVKIILCGPKECLPKTAPTGVEMTDNRDEAIEKSNALYLLRIQKERHKGVQASYYDTYPETYGVNMDLLRKMKKPLPIFHPGPANIGVEISDDLIRSDLYVGHHQVRNSIYMRMAIIQAILQNKDKNIGIPLNDGPRTFSF